jgi:hypothetical protein
MMLKKHYLCSWKKEKTFQGEVVFTTSSEKKCYNKFVKQSINFCPKKGVH